MANYTCTDTELTSIANAIRTKGGTQAQLEYPTGFVTAINNISTGTDTSDATAVASDIVLGKTAYAVGTKLTGTLDLSMSDANATAGDILDGKVAYTSGGKITGTILSKTAQTYTPGTTDQTIASGQYLSGDQTISGDANLVPEKIAYGTSIFGVAGEYGKKPTKDVRFYDYDGECLYEYTAEQFLELTELPPNPSHNGLVAQGWNWTLSDAKAVVNGCGGICIGQNYVTESGNTEIDIEVEEPLLKVGVYLTSLDPESSSVYYRRVTVYWGDGASDYSTSTSIGIVLKHTYFQAGAYTISIEPAEGTICRLGNNPTSSAGQGGIICVPAYDGIPTTGTYSSTMYQYMYSALRRCVKAVRIGTGSKFRNSGAFLNNYTEMETVTFPSDFTYYTSYQNNPYQAFDGYFYKLKAVIEARNSARRICYIYGARDLKAICPSSTTSYVDVNGMETLDYIVDRSNTLLDNSVSCYGETGFANYSVKKIIIPEGITGIAYQFAQTFRNLETVYLPSTLVSVETGSSGNCSSFSGCEKLKNVNLENCTSLTYVGSSMFAYCRSLTNITIPNSVTDIRYSAFASSALTSITIPSLVDTIGNYAFSYCYGLKEIHFMPSTPPTVSNSVAFSYLPTNCVIYVPTGSLSDYTSATNYPDPSTYTYTEE